jgi:hypothetical protein
MIPPLRPKGAVRDAPQSSLYAFRAARAIASTRLHCTVPETKGLYPHQADGVAFLLSKKRALLADDMGLGKTASHCRAGKRAVANSRELDVREVRVAIR